jgi:2-oxoisovalerate dehydrogenase E1 component beta subunit
MAATIKEAPLSLKKNLVTALKEAIFEEMSANPDMICMGEDIGILGGAFGVTDGLQKEFSSSRVIDMPISEAAIVGTAVGAAHKGKTCLVEMQFIDLIT